MDTPTLETLSERVDGLERENRWLKRIGGSAVIGLLALVTFGTGALRAPREISAEQIVLKDRDGHPRARLEMKEHGPALSLLDRDGRDQVLLKSGDDGSSSLEYFQGTDLRASLTNYANHGPALNLFEMNRRGRAEMFVTPEGGSGLTLHRYQWGAGLNMAPDGTAKLNFLDRKGQEKNGLVVAPDGTASAIGKPEPSSEGLGTAQANIPQKPAVLPAEGPSKVSTDVEVETESGESVCTPLGVNLGIGIFGAP